MNRDSYGAPLLIRDSQTIALKRVPVGLSGEGYTYDEDFIRNLAFDVPCCLPIAEIDSAYRDPVPICKELRNSSGFIDALFVTRDGRLIVLEAKLLRNPEARRKVIGQILDYAKELSHWGYEDLQREVAFAMGRKGNALFETVRERHPDLDEAAFVDAVSLALKQGKFLLLIVGDGIRGEAASIAEFVQRMGSLHFTFGLVELALYQGQDTGLFVQPRVLAKTEIIQRSVISIRDGMIEIEDDVEEQEEESEVSDSARWYEVFWTELLTRLRFDDPEQPMAKVTRVGNLYFAMPPGMSATWLSAYFVQAQGRVGVYLTFRRGAWADRVYASLSGEREQIQDEIGIPIHWKEGGDGKYMIQSFRDFGNAKDPVNREAVKVFLADTLNRYVSVFRPRLTRLTQAE